MKVDKDLLNWMDKELSERFITKKGITDKSEISNIKWTIWDFLASLELRQEKTLTN